MRNLLTLVVGFAFWGLFIYQVGSGQGLKQILFVRVAHLGLSHQTEAQRLSGRFTPGVPGMTPRTGTVGDIDNNGELAFYLPLPGKNSLLLSRTAAGKFHNLSNRIREGMQDSLSAAFSDYDLSGHQSLFVAGRDGIALYHNIGQHRFSAETQKAGLKLETGLVCDGIAIGDFDGDGFPDLVVAVYTDLNQPVAKPMAVFPNDFPGESSRLYRNNRNGTFTDVTQTAGLAGNAGRARKVILADFNNDGRLDILLLRDNKPPALYLNRGAWKFDDVTWDAGDDLTTNAFFEGSAADFDRDGKMDLVLWSTHSCRLLMNQGNATFKRSGVGSIPDPQLRVFGFRGLAGDFDGDGLDDLVAVDQAGHLRGFTNDSGRFLEVPLAFPDGLERGFLGWFQADDHRSIYVLAMQSDGHITLLQSLADH